MFDFLRALDLAPEEWEEAIARTAKGSPPTHEVVRELFRDVQAVVVILTPDEVATLRRELGGSGAGEPQARPNVIFEAGFAWGLYPERTLFVRIGPHRAISDIVGLYYWQFTGDQDSRHRLAGALKTAGCPAKTDHRRDWLTSGGAEFETALKLATAPTPGPASPPQPSEPRDPLTPYHWTEAHGILWDVNGVIAQPLRRMLRSKWSVGALERHQLWDFAEVHLPGGSPAHCPGGYSTTTCNAYRALSPIERQESEARRKLGGLLTMALAGAWCQSVGGRG
jgi:hypothetical protein